MTFLPPANEVWGKVICLQVSVTLFTGGGGGSGPGGSGPGWGVPGPGVRLVLGGGPGPGGVPGPGGSGLGGSGPRGVPAPPPGWLLLRAVRILRECILVVFNIFCTFYCHISLVHTMMAT